MTQKPRLLLNFAATVAISAILAAFAAWAVCWLYPRSYISAFLPCLIGGLVATLVLTTFNVVESCFIMGICVVLAVVSIPICARLQRPAVPAYIIASLASGMLSSRAVRRMGFAEW